MSDEPLYCMRCGQEDCDHADGWEVSGKDAKYCHTCGTRCPGGGCLDCHLAMGGTHYSWRGCDEDEDTPSE